MVLVHGLWMPGFDMIPLQRRLNARGFRALRFRYPSLRRAPRVNAAELAAFVDRINAPVLHFVGHSLGGLVIRHLFDTYPRQRPGHIVTIGTPHKPSHTAQTLYRAALLPLLGLSIEEGVIGGAPAWTGSHALGVIAGTQPIGVGRLMPGLPKPNDGTVAVSETNCDHMADHITVATTHTGLLFSREVAEQTALFLAEGRFRH